MGRIFALKDSNVDVIYVTPYEFPEEIVNYYSKILNIGEIDKYQSLFTIIVPENDIKLPKKLAVAAQLLYSPNAIKRIKLLIKGRNSYIVPGIISNDEIKLSNLLGVPMLSGEPQKVHLYSTKSGSRRIFNQANIPIPVGAYDIYDQNEFEILLTKLVLSNPFVSQWIFKIDNEFNGRGTASLSIENIKGIKDVRIGTLEINDAIIDTFQQRIHKELPLKTQIAMPSLFKNYECFINEFCKVGGVIEAKPNCPKGTLYSPSISFLIEPDGNIIMIGGYDKVCAPEFINSGCTFPQQSLQNIVNVNTEYSIDFECSWERII